MTSWKDTFDPLREFSRLIKYSDYEFEKYELQKKDFDENSYGWIIKTQKRLNMYVDDFQKSFYPKLRTAVEEQQLGDLQGKYIKKILSEVPTKDADIKELFYNKVLETFALHNRSLALNWNHENSS